MAGWLADWCHNEWATRSQPFDPAFILPSEVDEKKTGKSNLAEKDFPHGRYGTCGYLYMHKQTNIPRASDSSYGIRDSYCFLQVGMDPGLWYLMWLLFFSSHFPIYPFELACWRWCRWWCAYGKLLLTRSRTLITRTNERWVQSSSLNR